jgi:hypothetical protein
LRADGLAVAELRQEGHRFAQGYQLEAMHPRRVLPRVACCQAQMVNCSYSVREMMRGSGRTAGREFRHARKGVGRSGLCVEDRTLARRWLPGSSISQTKKDQAVLLSDCGCFRQGCKTRDTLAGVMCHTHYNQKNKLIEFTRQTRDL